MWKTYWRAVSQLAAEWQLALTVAATSLLLGALVFLEPWLFGRVVDSLVTKQPEHTWWLILSWAAAGMCGIASGSWASLQADRLAHRQRLAAIARFLDHALALPLAFHDSHHSGRLSRIMDAGSSALFSLWLPALREHLATVVSVLVTIPLAMYMSWKLALLMVALTGGFALFNFAAVRWTLASQSKVEGLKQEMAERASDVLQNAIVVQCFTRHEAEAATIRSLTQKVLAAQYPVLRGWATLTVASRAASTLTMVAILAWGATLNVRGEISVGGIVTFTGLAVTLIGRLEHFAAYVSAVFFHTPMLREFFGVIDTPSVLRDEAGRPHLAARTGGKVRGEVVFESVSFGYQPGQVALKALSFRAPAGATVALVGPTGAGKTTALSLLYRAYDPTVGRIAIDGVDIRDVSLSSLRKAIAVVFQDSGLLYRSIAENLRVGKPDATDEDLECSTKAAGAHDFIIVKPEGYRTLVAEGGRSLSGGERQRIAIARALLRDAPILILDEATSALDSVTEARVLGALRALRAGRTTFVIAHRLSTVRVADLILVLEAGELVESGTYSQLLANDGVFAQLSRRGAFVEDANSHLCVFR